MLAAHLFSGVCIRIKSSSERQAVECIVYITNTNVFSAGRLLLYITMNNGI